MRVLLFLFFIYIFNAPAALIFEPNHQKEIDLLKAFDIDPAFIYEPRMNKMKEQKRTKYQYKHFFQAMDDAYLYIPMIKNILSESDIPAEFLFLAMAESNFSTKAYSKKKASGLWQFMPYTGKRYGLKIDEYVDERRDLVKSTESAVRYLNVLHKRFGKWYLAAMAYNCGEGRLSRSIKKAGSDELEVLLDEDKKYLPRETRNYIRKIVALALLGTDESFLINSEYAYLLNRANAYSIVSIEVPRGERLSRVAKILSMPLKDLKSLNRHLKYDFVPPYAKAYHLYIPYIKLSEFKTKYKPSNINALYYVHIVSSGDNLSALGKKYHVSYKVIKEFNNLKSNRLSLKQKLIIPSARLDYKKKKRIKNAYVVKSGDTLESISRRFGLSISKLKRKNGLKNDLIRIGDRLSVK